MNKQELIKKYEMKGEQLKGFPVVAIGDVLKNLRELDEPEIVKIPEFAADVIEGARGYSAELEDALHYTWCNGTKEFTEWYRKKSNRDLFARAWLDGYEVEEEKRYRVKIKGTGQYLRKDENSIRFSSLFISDFTKDAIEDLGFGEVFNSPLFEIEEVE